MNLLSFILAIIMLTFSACASLRATPPPQWSSTQCPAGYYDMLTWMAPQPVFNGVNNATPGGAAGMLIVPTTNYPDNWKSGAMFMIKVPAGWAWDIDVFDKDYVYNWITGFAANYAYFEPYTSNLMFPRCVPNKGTAANGYFDWSVGTRVPTGDYNVATCTAPGQCTYTKPPTMNAVEAVWGPYPNDKLGSETQGYDTMVYDSTYGCDSNYQNCQYREQFFYQQEHGWVYWIFSEPINGQWQWKQVTDMTNFTPGTYSYVAPYGQR